MWPFSKTCTSCEADNDRGNQICIKCGEPLGPMLCSCGAAVPQDARFCPRCGKRADDPGPASGPARCQCGATIPEGGRFCPKCGRSVESESGDPQMGRSGGSRQGSGTYWRREQGDVATRIEPNDLEGFFRKGVDIQQGTEAMLFQNGAYVGKLPPGYHDLQTAKRFLQKITFSPETRSTLLLYDAYDLRVEWEQGRLQSVDHFELIANVEASLRIDQPEPFLVNFMKGRPRLATEDLKQDVARSVEQVLRDSVSTQTADDLIRNEATRGSVANRLTQRLRDVLSHLGLALSEFRLVRFASGFHEGELATGRRDFAEDLAKTRESIGREQVKYDIDRELAAKGIHRGVDAANLARDAMAVDNYTDRVRQEGTLDRGRQDAQFGLASDRLRQDTELTSRTQEVDYRRKRIEILREVGNVDLGQIRNEEDFSRLKQQVDRERILREDEWRVLALEMESRAQDDDVRRKHARAVLTKRLAQEEQDLEVLLAQQSRLKEIQGDTHLEDALRGQELRRATHQMGMEESGRRHEVHLKSIENSGVLGIDRESTTHSVWKSGVQFDEDKRQTRVETSVEADRKRTLGHADLDIDDRRMSLDDRTKERKVDRVVRAKDAKVDRLARLAEVKDRSKIVEGDLAYRAQRDQSDVKRELIAAAASAAMQRDQLEALGAALSGPEGLRAMAEIARARSPQEERADARAHELNKERIASERQKAALDSGLSAEQIMAATGNAGGAQMELQITKKELDLERKHHEEMTQRERERTASDHDKFGQVAGRAPVVVAPGMMGGAGVPVGGGEAQFYCRKHGIGGARSTCPECDKEQKG